MLNRTFSLVMIAFVAAIAAGCATPPPRVLINAENNITKCAMLGGGVMGSTIAQAGNTNCVADARSLGYLPIEEAGGIGVVFNDEDKVVSRLSVVMRGSPAAAAGLMVGDVVISVDGQLVPTRQATLIKLFGRAGESVAILVKRGDKEIKFTLVRASRSSLLQK